MSDKASLKPFYDKKPKILIRGVINRQDRIMATYTDQRLVFKKDINPFIITEPEWNCLYVLGILNSRLISYLYVNTSSIATKDDFRQTTLAELRRLPIPYLKMGEPLHDKLVSLVDRMLVLHKKKNTLPPSVEREKIEREIAVTDEKIDEIIYGLYGITEEERKIIEGR